MSKTTNLDKVFGKAKKIVVERLTTTIIEGRGAKEELEIRKNTIKKQIEIAPSYDIEKLRERLSKLTGGVAVISVGAATETEMTEKKLRVEDALNATKAAVAEGIVPGGGVALIRARKAIKELELNVEEQIGANIIYNAVASPLLQIANNAGHKGEVVVEKVESLTGSHGFNAANGKYEDLILAGVIDPTKVTRSALENAASIAGLMLTTECLVVQNRKDKKKKSEEELDN